MSEEIQRPLPELVDQVIDAATLATVLDDIGSLTGQVNAQVRIQGQVQGKMFVEAVSLFVNKQATALQIQYTFEGHEYRDTFMRVPSGIRLVRMRMEVFD
jgi:hypothetical protein